MRKPLIVWIMQFIGCFYTVKAVVTVVNALRALFPSDADGAINWQPLLTLGFFMFVAAVLVVMVIQLQRRSPVGRWLAIGLVVLLLTMGVATLPFRTGIGAWGWQFVSGASAVFALLIWWLYLICFSRKARAWFTKTDHDASPSAPR